MTLSRALRRKRAPLYTGTITSTSGFSRFTKRPCPRARAIPKGRAEWLQYPIQAPTHTPAPPLRPFASGRARRPGGDEAEALCSAQVRLGLQLMLRGAHAVTGAL